MSVPRGTSCWIGCRVSTSRCRGIPAMGATRHPASQRGDRQRTRAGAAAPKATNARCASDRPHKAGEFAAGDTSVGFGPSPGISLYNVEGTPTEIRGHQRAIGCCVFVLQRDAKALGFVGTDLHAGTPHDGHHLFTPSAAAMLRRSRGGRKRVRDGLCACVHADLLIAANLCNALHTPANR